MESPGFAAAFGRSRCQAGGGSAGVAAQNASRSRIERRDVLLSPSRSPPPDKPYVDIRAVTSQNAHRS
jgi:hypothetical protein